MTTHPAILTEHPLTVPGFNASIVPDGSGGWVGTSRMQIVLKGCPGFPKYPEVMNLTLLFTLDASFQVTRVTQVQEQSREKHTSWSTGIEDCRLLSPGQGTCVACDTNTNWKPEVCMFQLDSQTKTISSVKPIPYSFGNNQPQKNWLHLTTENDVYLFLQQSGNPFCVVAYNPSTHTTEIRATIPCPELNGQVLHNGAVIAIDQGYLLTVRRKKGYSYDGSIWILLGKDFSYKGHSEPFRFVEGSSYEMCMNLWLNPNHKDTIVASVGISDTHSSIFLLHLPAILASICLRTD